MFFWIEKYSYKTLNSPAKNYSIKKKRVRLKKMVLGERSQTTQHGDGNEGGKGRRTDNRAWHILRELERLSVSLPAIW